MTTGSDSLAGLDDVPWRTLYHAYGSAADVPDQLRALRSADRDVRQKAQWHLFGNVYHQGARWDASPATVPFLVALVAESTTPDRPGVLDLLVSIAIGDPSDDQLPFDPAAEFAEADRLIGIDLSGFLERFYD